MQNNRIRTKFIILLLLCFLFPESGYAQEINIDVEAIDSLLTTNSGNLVFDLNGEICSMVILTTNLASLKFYSNLGVEKITKTEDGYRIWIPNQATILKLIIPGFPLFEYNLPHSVYKYSVFIIILRTQKYEKTILKDTLQPRLSISTTTIKARIFLNGKYKGKSPMIINNPDFYKFDYTIEKKGYVSYSSRDSMDKKTKNISIELNDLYRNKRFFLTTSIKQDFPTDLHVSLYQADLPMYGLTFGVFGKTGMYGSINLLYSNKASDSRLGYNSHDKVQKLSIVSGVTQQLGKSIFIYGGPGYIKRYYLIYTDFADGTPIYSEGKSESLNLNTGLIFRVAWYSLLQLDFCKSINNSYVSLGLGLGYNFPKKTKSSIIKEAK